jgi:hypothetical protein
MQNAKCKMKAASMQSTWRHPAPGADDDCREHARQLVTLLAQRLQVLNAPEPQSETDADPIHGFPRFSESDLYVSKELPPRGGGLCFFQIGAYRCTSTDELVDQTSGAVRRRYAEGRPGSAAAELE